MLATPGHSCGFLSRGGLADAQGHAHDAQDAVAFFQITGRLEVPQTDEMRGHFFVYERLEEIAFFSSPRNDTLAM